MKRRLHPSFWSTLVLLGGLILAWRVMVSLETEQREQASARFRDLAIRATEQLAQRMQVYQFGLRGMRGALVNLGADGISRAGVHNYSLSRDQDKEFPGSRGYGFIRRVAAAEETAFLRRAQADGKPDFKIRQLSPHDQERLVIQYIEPEERNREAIGLDIASESNRRDAALKAIRTGEATLTHPITLVQASGKVKRGFLLLLPTYPAGSLPVTAEERKRTAYGLVYTPLVIDEILADFDFHHGEFALTLYDQADDGKSERFYESVDQAEPAKGLVERIPLELFGRQWTTEFTAQPPFIAALNQVPPGKIGLEIALVSLLLSGVLYGLLQMQERRREAFRQKSRLAAIVEGANDAIISIDLDHRITDWNPAAETIFGHPASAAIGHPVANLVVPEDLRSEEANLIARSLAGEVIHNIITRRRSSSGTDIDVSLTLTPIRDENGIVTGVAKTLRDITDQLAQQQRIIELNSALERKVAERTAHLEASNEELADFAYLASHDLRTPLRVIDGFSALLQRECEHRTPVEDEHLKRIRNAAQQMGRIIDDMVSLTEVVRLNIHPEPLNLSTLAEKIIAHLRSRDPQRQVEIVTAPDLPVHGDPAQLRTLLFQLLDNAWKFTHDVADARIEVGAGKTADTELIECFVRDNGIGFDMAYVDRLFTPFHRLNNSSDHGSSGIGLAIAKRIVRKHGGDIRAVGEAGAGATFTFSLPVPRKSS